MTDTQKELLQIPLHPPRRLTVKHGAGCTFCRGTGYHSRTGIYEIMPVSDRIRRMILAKSTDAELTEKARQDGMTTLREQAIKKVAAGVTSVSEILRVTSEME